MSTSYSWEGKGRYGSFRLRIERVGVQVKLWDSLRTRAVSECFWGDDSRRGAISSVCTFTFTKWWRWWRQSYRHFKDTWVTTITTQLESQRHWQSLSERLWKLQEQYVRKVLSFTASGQLCVPSKWTKALYLLLLVHYLLYMCVFLYTNCVLSFLCSITWDCCKISYWALHVLLIQMLIMWSDVTFLWRNRMIMKINIERRTCHIITKVKITILA